MEHNHPQPDLVHCRHCKTKPIYTYELVEGRYSHVIRCGNDKCGCALAHQDKENLIARWNRSHSMKHILFPQNQPPFPGGTK